MTDLEQDARFQRSRKLPRPLRIIYVRPRMFIAAAAGIISYFLLPESLRQAARLLIAWDVAIALYLALAFALAVRSDQPHMRRMALMQDDGRFLILVMTSLGAFASIAAIVSELSSNNRHSAQLILSTLTIALSWATVHATFALHYAHEYYRKSEPGGFIFPGHDDALDYWDFFYFSFTVGTSCAASDVGVTDKGIRRTVLMHSIIAFIFNTSLLALMVNIAASAI